MNVFMVLVQYNVPGEVFLGESGPGQKTLNTIGYCTVHTARNWTLDTVPCILLETGPWILYRSYYQKLDPGYCTLHTTRNWTLDTVPFILLETGPWILYRSYCQKLDPGYCTVHTTRNQILYTIGYCTPHTTRNWILDTIGYYTVFPAICILPRSHFTLNPRYFRVDWTLDTTGTQILY